MRPNFTFHGGCKQVTKKFSFSFCTWIWFLGIQLQECWLTRQVSWDNRDERSERLDQAWTTFTLYSLCMKKKLPFFHTKSYSCKIYRLSNVTKFPTGTDFLQTAAKFKEKRRVLGSIPLRTNPKAGFTKLPLQQLTKSNIVILINGSE